MNLAWKTTIREFIKSHSLDKGGGNMSVIYRSISNGLNNMKTIDDSMGKYDFCDKLKPPMLINLVQIGNNEYFFSTRD